MGLALGLFLISPGCRESELLEQIASDYFPVHLEFLWYYAVCGDTIEAVGGEESKIAGRNAYIIRKGLESQFFYTSNGISQLFWHRITVGDRAETLFIWVPHLPEFLVVGDEWDADYVLNDTVFGDEIIFNVQTEGEVLSRSGDICEVKRTTWISFSRICGSRDTVIERDTIDAHLWYKKDVGMERAIINGKEYRLIDYSLLGG